MRSIRINFANSASVDQIQKEGIKSFYLSLPSGPSSGMPSALNNGTALSEVMYEASSLLHYIVCSLLLNSQGTENSDKAMTEPANSSPNIVECVIQVYSGRMYRVCPLFRKY